MQSLDYRSRIKEDRASAERYRSRKNYKHRAEMGLVARAVDRHLFLGASILDIPCGVGRSAIVLGRNGYNMTAADLGTGALDVAREEFLRSGVQCELGKEDIEKMSYCDNAFDALLVFRMFHHFPTPQIRAKVVAEVCRVARRYVFISYLCPYSYTSIRRSLANRWLGRDIRQHSTSLQEVSAYFAQHGYVLEKDYAQMRFAKSLHLAVFRCV